MRPGRGGLSTASASQCAIVRKLRSTVICLEDTCSPKAACRHRIIEETRLSNSSRMRFA